MKPSCIKHTAIPGTTRLFSDYLYHFDRVSSFYEWDPCAPESFPHAAEQINFPAPRRSALVAALARQNPTAKAAIGELANHESVAVVTGQQVGLFSGPAYTVFKAITAAKLARSLRDGGRPAVPVFWLATEDHDLAEVDHAWIYTPRGEPRRVQAAADNAGGPVGRAVMSDIPIAQLADALDGFVYADDVLNLVRCSYREGQTLGLGFFELLRDVLKDLDLLFLDPLDPAIRKLAAPFLSEAVGRARELLTALAERGRDLETAEYHAQVHVDAETSLFFLLEGGRRVAFQYSSSGYSNKQLKFSTAELAQRAAELSPNALLRPVLQDYLLPTVAYIGGPAEIAYMAQASVIYRALLGRMPVIVPRNGFTLLDARAEKLIARYGLHVADLLDYEEHVRARIASRLVSADLEQRMDSARRLFEQELDQVRGGLRAFDSTLEAAAKKSSAKISYQLEKLSKKTAREALRRNARASEEADYLVNMVYPHRHLQERFYTILPFLAQHGLDLPARLMEETRLNCPDHVVAAVPDLPRLLYSD
jgi:bacillithiol biosynthesis cysteine-adding enzyme BshC